MSPGSEATRKKGPHEGALTSSSSIRECWHQWRAVSRIVTAFVTLLPGERILPRFVFFDHAVALHFRTARQASSRMASWPSFSAPALPTLGEGLRRSLALTMRRTSYRQAARSGGVN